MRRLSFEPFIDKEGSNNHFYQIKFIVIYSLIVEEVHGTAVLTRSGQVIDIHGHNVFQTEVACFNARFNFS